MKKRISRIRQTAEYNKIKKRPDFGQIESEIRSGKPLKQIATKYNLKYYQIRLIAPVVKSLRTVAAKSVRKKTKAKPKSKQKPKTKPKAKIKPKPKTKPKAAKKIPKKTSVKPKTPQSVYDRSKRRVKLKDGSEIDLYEIDYIYKPPVDIVLEGVWRVIAPLRYDIPRLKIDYRKNFIRYSYEIVTNKHNIRSGIGYTQFLDSTELRLSLEVAISDSLSLPSSLVVYELHVQVSELIT